MQRVKSKLITWIYQKQKLTTGCWRLLFPRAWRTKKQHMFSIVFVLPLTVLVASKELKTIVRSWNEATINTSNDSPVTTYLCSACNTSTSCMDTMSTPHLVPLSTNSELKGSMMMIVLRTGVWPFSRVCSSVSALLWLSQSTVEISAERRKLKLYYQLNRQYNSSKSWHQCCWYYEASSCTRLSSICRHQRRIRRITE